MECLNFYKLEIQTLSFSKDFKFVAIWELQMSLMSESTKRIKLLNLFFKDAPMLLQTEEHKVRQQLLLNTPKGQFSKFEKKQKNILLGEL